MDDLDRLVEGALRDKAEEVARLARIFNRQAHGPWMPSRKGSNISVQGTRIVNFDHAGHLVEYGSRNNPAHAPLRRAAIAAGLHLREDPRHGS